MAENLPRVRALSHKGGPAILAENLLRARALPCGSEHDALDTRADETAAAGEVLQRKKG